MHGRSQHIRRGGHGRVLRLIHVGTARKQCVQPRTHPGSKVKALVIFVDVRLREIFNRACSPKHTHFYVHLRARNSDLLISRGSRPGCQQLVLTEHMTRQQANARMPFTTLPLTISTCEDSLHCFPVSHSIMVCRVLIADCL